MSSATPSAPTPYHTEPLLIGDEEIRAGQHKVVRLPVGQLPSGTEIALHAHVYRGLKPGPGLLLLGGVHGDEINGIEIVRRCIKNGLLDSIDAGTVIAVPLLNIYGFINFSRDVPDGKDVNRAFPGTTSGSLASRVAGALYKSLLPFVDMGIDFHTGGRGTYNYPQIRYEAADERAFEMAAVFAAPIMVAGKPPAKSLRRVAHKNLGKSILTYEGGENLRYDGLSIERALLGVHRILTHYGFMPPADPLPAVAIRRFSRSSWVRAGRAGLFQWYKSSGNVVRKGEPLGVICDPTGVANDKRILCPKKGFIIGHANSAVVSQGDALFHVGIAGEEE